MAMPILGKSENEMTEEKSNTAWYLRRSMLRILRCLPRHLYCIQEPVYLAEPLLVQNLRRS